MNKIYNPLYKRINSPITPELSQCYCLCNEYKTTLKGNLDILPLKGFNYSEMGMVLDLQRSFFFLDVWLSMVSTTLPGSPTLKLLLITVSSAGVIFLFFCTITVYPSSALGTNSAPQFTSHPTTRTSQTRLLFCTSNNLSQHQICTLGLPT